MAPALMWQGARPSLSERGAREGDYSTVKEDPALMRRGPENLTTK